MKNDYGYMVALAPILTSSKASSLESTFGKSTPLTSSKAGVLTAAYLPARAAKHLLAIAGTCGLGVSCFPTPVSYRSFEVLIT